MALLCSQTHRLRHRRQSMRARGSGDGGEWWVGDGCKILTCLSGPSTQPLITGSTPHLTNLEPHSQILHLDHRGRLGHQRPARRVAGQAAGGRKDRASQAQVAVTCGTGGRQSSLRAWLRPPAASRQPRSTPSPPPSCPTAAAVAHLIHASLGAAPRAAGTSAISQDATRTISRLGREPSSAGRLFRRLKEACACVCVFVGDGVGWGWGCSAAGQVGRVACKSRAGEHPLRCGEVVPTLPHAPQPGPTHPPGA